MAGFRSKLLTVVGAAIVVGGITAAFVWASIPDSSGVIHACYPKAGTLRVIDSSNQSCGSKETAIAWSQSGGLSPAYGHIVGAYDAGTNTWTFRTDTARLSEVVSVEFKPDNEDPGRIDACITAEFEPRNISLTGGTVFAPIVAVRTKGVDEANHGWSSAKADAVCGDDGSNAFIGYVGPDTWFVLYP